MPSRQCEAFLIAAAITCLFPCPLDAQSTPQIPDAPTAQNAATPSADTEAQRKASVATEAKREVKTEEKQRILKVVPDFEAVLSGRAVQLSAGQKANLAVHEALDPFNFLGAFLFAGLDELTGSQRGYGWGPVGYLKRTGANLADVVDATMLAQGFFPVALDQDPRFFRMGHGAFKTRLRHALLSAFVCRGDNLRPQPNYSNILGNLTAGAFSNIYYPSNERGIRHTLITSSVITI